MRLPGVMPLYAREGEWDQTNWQTIFTRVVVGGLMLKIGYEFGKWDSIDEKLKQG